MPINMRKEERFVVVGLLMWAVTCHGQADDAATSPLWLRYPAISPSADHIAFSYGGDLYPTASLPPEEPPPTSHNTPPTTIAPYGRPTESTSGSGPTDTGISMFVRRSR